MRVGDVCQRAVVTIDDTADLTAAAEQMRIHHVGFLIVHRAGDELRRPVGVITDRDIVVAVVAKKVDPATLTVEDLMTRDPLVAQESEDLAHVLQGMRNAGIRRVPVVDARGALCGVFAIDDAFEIITNFMCDITGSVKNQQRQERRARAF